MYRNSEESIIYFDYVMWAFETLNRLVQAVGNSISTGIRNKLDKTQTWLNNIRYMHAIAEINGIEFVSCMQPLLLSKKETYLAQREKRWIKMLSSTMTKSQIEFAQQFRVNASVYASAYPYIHDLCHIFDNEDVYIDGGHVYERGNEILADSIWEIIKDRIPEECKRR